MGVTVVLVVILVILSGAAVFIEYLIYKRKVLDFSRVPMFLGIANHLQIMAQLCGWHPVWTAIAGILYFIFLVMLGKLIARES